MSRPTTRILRLKLPHWPKMWAGEAINTRKQSAQCFATDRSTPSAAEAPATGVDDIEDEGFAMPRRLDDLVFWNETRPGFHPLSTSCQEVLTDNDFECSYSTNSMTSTISRSSSTIATSICCPNGRREESQQQGLNEEAMVGRALRRVSVGSASNTFRPNQQEQWSQRYQEIIEFRDKFGHCLVPLNWPDSPPLAHWVSDSERHTSRLCHYSSLRTHTFFTTLKVKRQRHQYRVKSDGKHSTLTQERLEALERLGFV